MIFLSSFLVQGLIIVGVLLLFLVTYTLNRKTKAPKGVEVPEKCQSCISNSCIIKQKDVELIKEELRQELDKCETGDNNETK
jgi:hypothetical protein